MAFLLKEGSLKDENKKTNNVQAPQRPRRREDEIYENLMAGNQPQPQEQGLVSNILSGASRGAKSGFGGILGGLGYATQAETGYGGDFAKSMNDLSEANARRKRYEWSDMIPFSSDYYTSPEGASYDVGQVVGSMAVPLALGAGTAATLGTGGTALPVVGAGLGGLVMAASEGGNTYKQALDEGYSEDEARSAGRTDAMIKAPFYMLSEGLTGAAGKALMSKAGKEAVKQGLGRTILKKGGTLLGEGVNEGLEEVFENRSSDYALNRNNDKSFMNDVLAGTVNPYNWSEDDQEAFRSAFMGSLLTGGIGAGAAKVYHTAMGENAETETKPTRQTEEPAQETAQEETPEEPRTAQMIDERIKEIDTEIETAALNGDTEEIARLGEEKKELIDEKKNILPDDLPSLQKLQGEVDTQIEQVSKEIESAIENIGDAKDKQKAAEHLQELYAKRGELGARSEQIASKIEMAKVPRTSNTSQQNNAGSINYGNDFATRMAQAEAIDTGNAQRVQGQDIAQGIGRAQGSDYGTQMGEPAQQPQQWQGYRAPQQPVQQRVAPNPQSLEQQRNQLLQRMAAQRAVQNGQLSWGDDQQAINQGARLAGENQQVAQGLPMNTTSQGASMSPSEQIAQQVRSQNQATQQGSDAVAGAYKRKREEQRRQAEAKRKAEEEARRKAEEERKRREEAERKRKEEEERKRREEEERKRKAEEERKRKEEEERKRKEEEERKAKEERRAIVKDFHSKEKELIAQFLDSVKQGDSTAEVSRKFRSYKGKIVALHTKVKKDGKLSEGMIEALKESYTEKFAEAKDKALEKAKSKPAVTTEPQKTTEPKGERLAYETQEFYSKFNTGFGTQKVDSKSKADLDELGYWGTKTVKTDNYGNVLITRDVTVVEHKNNAKINGVQKLADSQWKSTNSRLNEVQAKLNKGDLKEYDFVPYTKVATDNKSTEKNLYFTRGVTGAYRAGANAVKYLLNTFGDDLKFAIVETDSFGKQFVAYKENADGTKTLCGTIDSFYQTTSSSAPNAKELDKIDLSKVYIGRQGKDYRNGKDVSEKDIIDKFALYGVEFKDSQSKEKKQERLNKLYDSLSDLADVLGVEPSALSLGGRIRITLANKLPQGSYGNMTPVFSLSEVGEIRLTDNELAHSGSLAHEWLHSLDNYFAILGADYDYMFSDTRAAASLSTEKTKEAIDNLAQRVTTAYRVKTRPEVLAAFSNVYRVIKETGMEQRSKERDKGSKKYYSLSYEMFARSFATYISQKLQARGEVNNSLTGTRMFKYTKDNQWVSEEQFSEVRPEDVKAITEAYDNLFKTLLTKETQGLNGKTVQTFYSATEEKQLTRAFSDVVEELVKANPGAKFAVNLDGSLAMELQDGSKVKVNIADNIVLNESDQANAKASHGLTGNAIIQGMWEKATEAGYDRVLTISRNSEVGTAFHEALHSAMDLALTKREKDALYKYYSNQAEKLGMDVEEVIADAYRDWVLSRQNGQGTMFGKLWRKVKDFCNRMLSAFSKSAEANRIFQDIESGKVRERGNVNENINKAETNKNQNSKSEQGEVSEQGSLKGEEEKVSEVKYSARPVDAKKLSVASDFDYGHKEKQFDIISKNNPMNDQYHTGIRSVNDIMSFEQAYELGLKDSDGLFDEYPDWNAKMAKEIMDTPKDKRKVTIYSSKPIQPGAFVTPSRKMAEDYAGGGKIYTKTVPVERVAWVNANEGQFAWVKESDVHYDNLSSAQKQAVDKYLSEGGDNDRLGRLLKSPSYRETPWAHQAYNAILWKMAARELMAGREPNFYSALSDDTTKKAHDLMLANGEQGAWDYVLGTVDKFIGHPEKPLNAINASYTNCNPSLDCAKFCYAATGRNYAVNMNKQEMVNFLIEEFPVESARRVAEQYRTTTEFDAQKALRILDKGDISEKWLPFIKEVNKHGVRLQIFSKRAELLSKIDADRNLVMLSIDSSNAGLADKYKDLPLAFVWSGPQDNARLEKERARFERLGGVILPVRIGKKVLDAETIAKIPDWAEPYRCPIDAGLKQIGDHNCTQCDKNGGMGCFFGRVTTEVMKKLAEMEDLSNDKVSAMIKEKIDELSELYALKGQNIDERERQQLRKFLDARYAGGVGRNDTRTETGEDGRNGRVSERSGRTEEEERGNSGEVLQRTSREEVTQNPKFKEWFGNSKLVDEDDKPIVLYRGIEEKYDVGKQGEVTWVTPNKEQADSYRNGTAGSELLEVYARVEKPLYLGDSWTEHSVSSLVKNKLLPALNKAFQNKQLTREQGLKLRNKLNEMIKNDNGEMVPLFELYNDNPDVLSVIKGMGYDAIEVEEGGNRTYGVIGKSNVKSATDNNGNFSRDNDDIHYSVGQEEINRAYDEVLEEGKQAFPNGKFERDKNNNLIVTLPNGDKFQYSIKDNIILNAKDQKKAMESHGTSSGVVQGYWKKFTQNGVNRILAVSKNSERGTAFHEAMHAAIDLALTKRERDALYKYYEKVAQQQNRDVEEVVADAYRDWVLARKDNQGTMFGKLWRKVKDFCTRVKGLFDKGAEVQSIFQDVESGSVYERGTRNNAPMGGKIKTFINTDVDLEEKIKPIPLNVYDGDNIPDVSSEEIEKYIKDNLVGKNTHAINLKETLDISFDNGDEYNILHVAGANATKGRNGRRNRKTLASIFNDFENVLKNSVLVEVYSGEPNHRGNRTQESDKHDALTKVVVKAVMPVNLGKAGNFVLDIQAHGLYEPQNGEIIEVAPYEIYPRKIKSPDTANTASTSEDGYSLQELLYNVKPINGKQGEYYIDHETNAPIFEADKGKWYFKSKQNDGHYSVRAEDTNETPEARGARAVSRSKAPTVRERLESVRDSFYKDWVDKLDPLNKLQAEIENAIGQKLDYDRNVYKQARMAESTARGRAEMLVMGEDAEATVEAINKTMKGKKLKHAVTLRSVFDLIKDADMSKKHPDYLANGGFENWQHAFSTYLTARRQLELQKKNPDYVGPMDNKDAKAIVNNAPSELAEAAKKYYQYNDNMLTIAEDAGLISESVHNALNTKYSDYAPMMRDFSDTAGVDSFFGGLGGRGIGNVSNFLKKISKDGSSRNVIDPLETTVKNTYMILDRAERNKVAQLFVDLSHENGIGEYIEPVDRESSDPKNSIFTVMVDGKKQAFKTMPEFYGAIAGCNEQGAGAIGSLIRSAAQCLRTGATISPDFMFRNLVRDTIFAGISSQTGFRPLIDTIKGMQALRHNKELAEEFRAAGVPMSNFVGTNRRGAAETLDKLTGGDKKYHKLDPRRIISALYEMAQDYSELAEEGTRMGEFMRARAQGKSIEEAGFLAKEITLDFSRSGTYGQKYNQAVPFFNACIQGGDKFVRLMKQEPRATFMGVAKYIILPSLALWCMNHDEDWYKDLPEDVKNGSWCIKTGDTIWRIPKPQEAGVLFGSGMERFLDAVNDENPKAVENWAHHYFMDVVKPNLIPTLVLPIIEWNTNYSFFTGKEIVGTKYKRLPEEQQYSLYTTELAKRVGSVTGTSPLKIDNTIKGYFGTAGSFVATSMDNIFGKEYESPEKRWSEYAGIRGITYQEGRRSQAVSDFYELVDEANKQHEGYGKKGKPAGYVVGLRQANKKISDLNKDIREITVARNLTPEQKRAKIDKANLQIRNIAKLALARYKDKVNS